MHRETGWNRQPGPQSRPPTSGSKPRGWWGIRRGAGSPFRLCPPKRSPAQPQPGPTPAPGLAPPVLCCGPHLGEASPQEWGSSLTLLPFRASILFSNVSGPRASWCPQDVDPAVFLSDPPSSHARPPGCRERDPGPEVPAVPPCRMWDSGFRARQGGLSEGQTRRPGQDPSPVADALRLPAIPGFVSTFRGSFLSDTSGHRREREATDAHMQHARAVPHSFLPGPNVSPAQVTYHQNFGERGAATGQWVNRDPVGFAVSTGHQSAGHTWDQSLRYVPMRPPGGLCHRREVCLLTPSWDPHQTLTPKKQGASSV